MSRSGYTDECDNARLLYMYRGAVLSATRGARGQALLRDLLAALDAMPVKELIIGLDQIVREHYPEYESEEQQ